MEKQKTQAPVSWAQLLEDAVNQPGVISDAYHAFHGYSLGNRLMAWWQCALRGQPIGPLATYKGWQQRGRQVRKGEKALVLCQPVTVRRSEENEQGDEEKIAFQLFMYRARWFTVHQTDGADQGEAKVPGWDKARALDALQVAQVRFEYPDGNCQGYATARRFAINPVAQHAERTTFHELGHIVLGHTAEGQVADGDKTPRTLREVEAESVAMICCAVLGLPGIEESRGYIQNWLNGPGIPEKSAQKIFSAAQTILAAGHEQSQTKAADEQAA